MAVMITDSCINCDSCIEECPATAIVSADDAPIVGFEHTYVKPEKCIECADSTVPKCADICPTEGAIVWDMPYIAEFNDYYKSGHESGIYGIREHKSKGFMFPENSPKPYRESISQEDRVAHKNVSA